MPDLRDFRRTGAKSFRVDAQCSPIKARHVIEVDQLVDFLNPSQETPTYIRHLCKVSVLAKISKFLLLKAGVGDRLRAARTELAQKQANLAELGGVARATQISYETGVTEPTTAYLRAIQVSGIDMPLVLFGQPRSELDARTQEVEWSLLQQAHEDVEFFCQRFAPQCPASYRWQIVKELYLAQFPLKDGVDSVPMPSPMSLLSTIWERYTQT